MFSELVSLKIKEVDSFLISLSCLSFAQVIWLFMFRMWVNNYKVDAHSLQALGGVIISLLEHRLFICWDLF